MRDRLLRLRSPGAKANRPNAAEMPDVKPLLVANLLEALRQIQTYVVLGLGTAFSALVLALAAPGNGQMVVPGTFVPVTPLTAEGLLLVICFLVGLMAAYAAENARTVAHRLSESPQVLAACTTYPSIATSPYWGVRLAAALLPVMLSLIAIAVSASRNPELARILYLVGFLIVGAYGALALEWRDGALFINTARRTRTAR